jgi:hypothetical protein
MKVLKKLYLIAGNVPTQKYLNKDTEALVFFLKRVRYISNYSDDAFVRAIRISIPKSIVSIMTGPPRCIVFQDQHLELLGTNHLVELTDEEAKAIIGPEKEMKLYQFIIATGKYLNQWQVDIKRR